MEDNHDQKNANFHLESAKSIPQLNDVDQAVEVVGCEDEAVALLHGAPPAQHQVPGEAVLQGPGEVLVEDGVEVIVVSPRVADLELTGQPRVAVISPLGVVIPLPELHWADIGAHEDGGAEERVEWRGEDAGEDGLEEQHGRVGHGEGLGKCVEG